jgi:hypothetical protein
MVELQMDIRRAPTEGGGAPDLFQESPLLNDVGDGLLPYALCFVDVLEGIELFGSFVLHHPDLERRGGDLGLEAYRRSDVADLPKGTLAYGSVEVKVVEIDLAVKVYRFREAAPHGAWMEREGGAADSALCNGEREKRGRGQRYNFFPFCGQGLKESPVSDSDTCARW